MLLGCAPGERPALPADAAPTPDAFVPAQPEGSWEPDPGIGRTNALIVATFPNGKRAVISGASAPIGWTSSPPCATTLSIVSATLSTMM